MAEYVSTLICRFGEIQYHKVRIFLGDDQEKEDWILDNLNGKWGCYYNPMHSMDYYFEEEEDVMAFRLVWSEDE